jgi:hypothetical protein
MKELRERLDLFKNKKKAVAIRNSRMIVPPRWAAGAAHLLT